MWTKNEPGDPPATTAVKPMTSDAPSKTDAATIGPSITLNGTLSGGEDLCIEGRLEGEISVEQHSVTVGRQGRVKADIYGKAIWVEGEVKGNLFGKEQVVIRQSGKVIGNVTSPRVSLENGSHFRGNIDMQPVAARKSAREGRPDKTGAESAAGPRRASGS